MEGKGQRVVVSIQNAAVALNHGLGMPCSMVSHQQFPVKGTVPPLGQGEGLAGEGEQTPPSPCCKCESSRQGGVGAWVNQLTGRGEELAWEKVASMTGSMTGAKRETFPCMQS